jgi:hypothetical protein
MSRMMSRTEITLPSSIEAEIAAGLRWSSSGDDWILFSRRRRMGRVVTSSCPGMHRVGLSGGRVSQMANLSWSKAHAMEAALRELAYEARSRVTPNPATDPSKCPVKEGSTAASSSLVS